MRPGQPRHVLLDIGMVLVGLNFGRLAEKMGKLTGLDASQLKELLTAHNLIRRYETGEINSTEFYQEVCRRAGTGISWPDFLEAWNSIFERPLVPDEMLASLAQRIHLWAVSNTNPLHMEFMTREFTFLRHFKGFVLSHEVGALKPDGRMFSRALELTQAPASDVLFIDDQKDYVRAAQELGIDGFRFQDANQFAAELRARGLL